MTELPNNHIAVEVPPKVSVRVEGNRIEYGVKRHGIFYKILPGNDTLVGISDSITEEQADGIVDIMVHSRLAIRVFRDYSVEKGICATAIQSLDSYFKSKGLTKRYAILKKEV